METINGNYREYTLDNGLVVALQETPTKTFAGRLRIMHGSLNEKPGEEGIAHFLEHGLMTGGSKNYDPKKSDSIRGKFDDFNAATGLKRTFFMVDTLAEDIQPFIEYISDTIFNPRFDISKVEEQRKIILQEIRDKKSDSVLKDQKTYSEAFFGKNSPHTYSGLGGEDVINSASTEDLRAFHKRGYYPNNMDFILVGALPKDIDKLVEKNFGSFQPGNVKKVEFPRNPGLSGPTFIHTYAPELFNEENHEKSSAHLSISLFAPTETDKDTYAVSMLVDILGVGENSRIFRSVRDKKGLAYNLNALYDPTENRGVIDIIASIPSLRSEEAINTIFEEMAILQTHLVSQDTLERLKKKSRYKLAKTFETNPGHVYAIESKIDKGLTPEHNLKRLGKVTPEDIRQAAVKYLPKNREADYVLMLRDPLKK